MNESQNTETETTAVRSDEEYTASTGVRRLDVGGVRVGKQVDVQPYREVIERSVEERVPVLPSSASSRAHGRSARWPYRPLPRPNRHGAKPVRLSALPHLVEPGR